jgi:hypothetical protein
MQEPDKRRNGVSQLLIASAIDADLRRRLLESPEETFQDYDLTEEEKDVLRAPHHRMLRLLGAALAHDRAHDRAETGRAGPRPADAPHAVVEAPTLPGISLALTLVPCAQYVNGRFSKIAYAVWVNPLPEGADPAALPMPQGAALPGEPLTPLHAVIEVSAVQMQDLEGKPQVALSASLRRSTNVTAPPPSESAGRPEAPPFGSDLGSVEVKTAVAAVRSAAREERYGRLLDLIRALRGGEAR